MLRQPSDVKGQVFGCHQDECRMAFEKPYDLWFHTNDRHSRCPHCKKIFLHGFVNHVKSCSQRSQATETMATLEVEGSSQGRARHQPSHQLLIAQPAAENTSTLGRLPQDHYQSQNEDPSENAALDLSEPSLPNRDGLTVHVSNHQLTQATEDTRGRDETPVPDAGDAELLIDPALFHDQQACNDDDEDEGGNNTSLGGDEDRPLPPAPCDSIPFHKADSQSAHQRGAKRRKTQGRHWGQDRGLLTPASTFETEDITQRREMSASDVREGSITHVSNGAPSSSPMAIQSQQPVSLDADPAEYGNNDGYNSLSMLHNEHLVRSVHQQTGFKRNQLRQREQTRKWPRTREWNVSEITATPKVGDSGQSQDARNEPESQMLSKAQSGVRPDHQPQQVAKNTTRGWFSIILNSPATITSDHSIQPLADGSGHGYESSQARSPLQASPTASPYSTNELPRHRDRLASELDYSKEASATVQHSGHPVTALSAVAQSTEGEAGSRAAKPDRSGQSTQPTESRRKFKPRNAIKLLTAPPSPPTLVSSDGIQSSGPRASWLGRDSAAIHVSDEPSDHLLNDSPTNCTLRRRNWVRHDSR
ncbi:hypothetical protein NCS55_01490700 [Fusarium keratoplasticum]|nr:hypothetical protein NCS55_01490700 [Fusarium keratoplasticum]